MKPVWCVAWAERPVPTFKHTVIHFCATKDNKKPSEDAVSDETECNHFVTLRIGSEKRIPTCPHCAVAVTRKQRV